MHLMGGGTLNRLARSCGGCGCCWTATGSFGASFGWSSTNPLIVCRSIVGSPQFMVARGGGGNLYWEGRGLIGGGPGFRLAGNDGNICA